MSALQHVPMQATLVRMDDVHVLLLQRDEGLAEVLQEILSEHGLTTLVSSGCSARIRSITPDGRHARMVLADLPGKTANELRAFVADMAPVPVGFLTALGELTRESTGAAFVLRKPLDIDELLAAVAAALSLPETASAGRERELVSQYFEALARNDWSALSRVVHDKIIYNLPTDAPHGGIVVGREPFLEYTAKVFGEYPAVSFDVESQLPLVRSRVARYMGAWDTPNGRVALGGHVVFGFDGDAIARVGVHLDAQRLSALRRAH